MYLLLPVSFLFRVLLPVFSFESKLRGSPIDLGVEHLERRVGVAILLDDELLVL